MKDYKNYSLDDFLLDDDFRALVVADQENKTDILNEIASRYPGKAADIYRAAEIILALREHDAGLSPGEFELEVNRILQTTAPDKKIGFNPFTYRLNWISLAASVLILLGIGWGITRNSHQPQSAKIYREYIASVPEALREVVNENSAPLQIKLPDGSRVKLMPNSRVSYADKFVNNSKREIYLSGEAFFDVAKDSKNPFFVYANGLLTRVVGTSFLVRAIDANVEVLVSSGKVTVLPVKDLDKQENKNTELLLTPNQQAFYSTKDNLISKSIVAAPVEIGKEVPEPNFVFDNLPVSEVFGILEKAYGIPIVFDEPTMRNCSLRVALSNEPFFTKLDIVCKTVDASYQVRDGQIIVSSEGCN